MSMVYCVLAPKYYCSCRSIVPLIKAMSNQGEGEPKGQFGSGMQELSFNQTPCGSQATDSAFTNFKLA